MDIQQLKCLVEEYRLAEKRLNKMTEEYVKLKTALEIAKDLGQELDYEWKKAQERNDPELAEFWHDLLQNYFPKDKDTPSEEVFEKEKKKMEAEEKKLIVYYRKKIEVIKKFLGGRQAEILEGYEKKNVLMGTSSTSSRNAEIIEEEEEEEREREQKKKKGGFTFDKM